MSEAAPSASKRKVTGRLPISSSPSKKVTFDGGTAGRPAARKLRRVDSHKDGVEPESSRPTQTPGLTGTTIDLTHDASARAQLAKEAAALTLAEVEAKEAAAAAASAAAFLESNGAGSIPELASSTAAANGGTNTSEKQPSKDKPIPAPRQPIPPRVANIPPADPEEFAADDYVSRKLTAVQNAIGELCKKHFDYKLAEVGCNSRENIQAFIGAQPYELIRHAAIVGVGGPGGDEGWEELFNEPVLRQALVCGIISRALKEHVLSSLAFGAPQDSLMELREMEDEQSGRDGFYRASMRATHIKAIYGDTAHEKWDQDRASVRLALQLERMFRPMLEFKPMEDLIGPDAESTIPQFAAELMPIIKGAAVLNGFIRQYGAAVYHFCPIFKEENFDPSYMQCLNLRDMQLQSPLKPSEKEAANNPHGNPDHESLVRVVGSLALVAYRKGGGFEADRILRMEEMAEQKTASATKRPVRRTAAHDQVYTPENGIRTRRLTKAAVACYWGKPEVLGKNGDNARTSLLELWEQYAEAVQRTLS